MACCIRAKSECRASCDVSECKCKCRWETEWEEEKAGCTLHIEETRQSKQKDNGRGGEKDGEKK